eukprot:6792835-Alexandrium_andersonii.AAC.1
MEGRRRHGGDREQWSAADCHLWDSSWCSAHFGYAGAPFQSQGVQNPPLNPLAAPFYPPGYEPPAQEEA